MKLKKITTEGSSLITTKYAGNYVYEKIGSGSEVLQFFNHAEGYAEPVSTGSTAFKYVYQYKDHTSARLSAGLGNIRLSYSDTNNDGVITATTEILEENNYYPFGLKHKGYNNTQNGRDHKYGFGNKEEQNELGLSWIDITARNYDVALGRWMNLDPLAEGMRRFSPYNYAWDNPINVIDPDGMFGIFINKDGEKIGEDSVGEADGKVFVVEGSSKRKVKRATKNGETIETDELKEFHELPDTQTKEKLSTLVDRGKGDDNKEFSSTFIQQKDGSVYEHNVEGEEFTPESKAAEVNPLEGLPSDKKGFIKVIAHTHNVDPNKFNTEEKTFTATGKPSEKDFKIAASSGNAINVVFNTRDGKVFLIKVLKSNNKEQKVKLKEAAFFKKSYN